MHLYRTHLKRPLDFCAAGLGLLLLAPLIGVLALLVRWKLGTPVLFRQTRPGLNGKPFELVKFRTMTDARDTKGNLLPDADRLTGFGRFLRKSSLDELPELWNILKGDMSLVGPRPLLMAYIRYYTDREATRQHVRPGLTGLSQVNGRNYLLWDDRLEMDVQYMESVGFMMDIKILCRTVQQVIRRKDVLAVPSVLQGRLDEWRRANCISPKHNDRIQEGREINGPTS